MLLKDKVALVTGGGKGIGKAIALAFAREGADVVVAARTESDLNEVVSEINEIGRKSLAIITDLAVPEQIEAMVDKTLATFERVDVLVNNSGIEGPIMNVVDMDLDAWNQALAVNHTGTMLCTKQILQKSMLPRLSGNVINISSILGRKGLATRSSYSSTKWAMVSFTQNLAFEVGRLGIRVNCIAPGMVEGDRIDRVIDGLSNAFGIDREVAIETAVSQVAMGRMVKPEEVASLAVFLASDQSSGIIGQTINCCCGMQMN